MLPSGCDLTLLFGKQEIEKERGMKRIGGGRAREDKTQDAPSKRKAPLTRKVFTWKAQPTGASSDSSASAPAAPATQAAQAAPRVATCGGFTVNRGCLRRFHLRRGRLWRCDFGGSVACAGVILGRGRSRRFYFGPWSPVAVQV